MAVSYGRDSGSKNTALSVFWWGGDIRAKLTHDALMLYSQRHPQVTFKEQWQGNSAYFDKLATLSAGGNAPDLFALDDNWITEYTSRGVALDLKPLIGKQIVTTGFAKGLAEAGAVGGKLGGIAAAENTPAMIYDKTVLKQYNLAEPTVGMSWDDLITWAAGVTRASGRKVAGTMDPSADYKALQVWLRQQGKDLYLNGGLGFGPAELTTWLQLWQEAGDLGATPSADVIHAANAGDITKQLIATKQAATSFVWSNQLEELSKKTDHELGLVPYPGNPIGQWARASMYWAAYSGTEHPEVVASVIDFLVNDPDAAKILGAERGLAPNLKVRETVAPTLSPAMQKSVEFESSLAGQFGPTPTPPPKGHSQVRAQLTQAAERVQFDQATPAEAAAEFFRQVTPLLNG